MLRSLVFKRASSTGVWSEFSSRSPSLGLQDPRIKKALFSKSKPASLDAKRREAYHSPELIDDTFSEAYEFLQGNSKKIYNQIDSLKKESSPNMEEISKLSVEAEKYNPEVLYNAFNMPRDKLDMSQPVYREFAKKQWELYDLMVTMQRLEQLHVIPDTMPTLDPKVDVKVKFPHNIKGEFSDWIAPGNVVPCFSVSRPPLIQVQDFEGSQDHLYTVVIVNPDTPDLEKNSFKTTLHYGLSNVKLNAVDTVIPSTVEGAFSEYLPLTPEVNAQKQRACLWVFRQNAEINVSQIPRENFDIRAFAEQHGLTAVGAHVWRQMYDRSVNEIREKYGLGKGRVFEKVRGTKPLKN